MKNIILENKKFSLTVGEDAQAKSLIYKESGEELLYPGEEIALFSLTQLRPFNNEVKLAYMNKRTTFEANKIELSGNEMTVSFEIIPCKAIVSFDIKEDYISFTLSDFIFSDEAYGGLCMDMPPVEEFRLLQLPIKNRKNFGRWINAVWDDSASACVLATMPEALIDSEKRKNYRILTATAKKEIQLKGVSAALIVSGGKEAFLDTVDKFERDYGLPLGVESRRNPKINRSIYSARFACPANIDEHIRLAKKGGFECMLIYYDAICRIDSYSYSTCGDYDFNDNYPNGFDDLKFVLKKIKDAGITPGIHFLHTHVGIRSRYVKGKADHRLNLIEYYTLSRPLGLDDDKVYIEQNPKNATTYDMKKVLKFGTELMLYEGYTTERPYYFYGVKRGHLDTDVTSHQKGEIGGQLDVTEYLCTSIYLNQHTDMQEEVGGKLAALYNCGFEFVYFDGSEGTNPPYEYHVPNAQYRVIKMMEKPPVFCEGAAKAHFSWHYVSGGNAFDTFSANVFKRMIDKHPLREAEEARADFTRVNFGWWSFNKSMQKDIYEYGTSRAFAWDCPITMIGRIDALHEHPRLNDMLEVIRRWEYARKNNILTEEQKELLKVPGNEHTLLINEKGELELVPYYEVSGVGGENADISAFVFERIGKAYAVIWHRSADAKLKIPLKDAKYERDIGKELLPVEKSEDSITVTVDDAAYLSADISLSEMEEALKAAKTV